uniref:Mitochondrial import inner membrane translocase subunit TIM17 n=1 Tax=Chlamydomonas euryale TaxID=1486919 RepID=A0A7R9YV12_9CHLO
MAAPGAHGQQSVQIEHQREPCPDRIIDDIGGAFGMGAVGGGAWHLIKGLRNSPPGFRAQGALEALRRESPKLGGSFANWGLTFSLFDCSLQYVRKKEDPWNAIGAGALTGGFLQLRSGFRSAAKSAAFGGVLLAIIEGLGIFVGRLASPPPPGVPQGIDMGPPPADPLPAAASSSGGWFGFLGGGEQAAPAPVPTTEVHHITDDAFTPPPLPSEFSSVGGDGKR